MYSYATNHAIYMYIYMLIIILCTEPTAYTPICMRRMNTYELTNHGLPISLGLNQYTKWGCTSWFPCKNLWFPQEIPWCPCKNLWFASNTWLPGFCRTRMMSEKRFRPSASAGEPVKSGRALTIPRFLITTGQEENTWRGHRQQDW